jgi:hypothetical protein
MICVGLSCTCAPSLRRQDIWTADNKLILSCVACPLSQVTLIISLKYLLAQMASFSYHLLLLVVVLN